LVEADREAGAVCESRLRRVWDIAETCVRDSDSPFVSTYLNGSCYRERRSDRFGTPGTWSPHRNDARVSADIGVHARKRLWVRSGGRCAFPDCDEQLLEPIEGTDEDTIVGVECHIVARKDSAQIARSESSLTTEERERFASLIEDRHGFANLVLMCSRHSRVIDDPRAPYDVATVVAMKRDHEAAIAADRSPEQRRQDDLELRQTAIIDEWERRIGLDEWRERYGSIFSDGHPRMQREHFEELTETRRWMFSRVWPRAGTPVEEAFENFRYVAQDLQLIFEQYPHEHLARRGVVAPARFYNSPEWSRRFDHHTLDKMYEWYAGLLEDLALELTRAANLVSEAVRQTIDSRYRLDEGHVTLESGPYMMEGFPTRLHRPRYKASDGWAPYPGLREFLIKRAERDEHSGSGPAPDGLSLPGDSLFG
jgi:hypothetical protein